MSKELLKCVVDNVGKSSGRDYIKDVYSQYGGDEESFENNLYDVLNSNDESKKLSPYEQQSIMEKSMLDEQLKNFGRFKTKLFLKELSKYTEIA